MVEVTVTPPEQTQWPITVVLRRAMKEMKGWQYPSWSLVSIESGADLDGVEEKRVDEGVRDFRWGGMVLVLRRSDAETYWYNLTSQRPSIFVICREDPQYGLMPMMVTLDQDQSAREQESENEIFAAPIPDWLIAGVEQFVLAHYKPQDKRGKRRRKPQESSDEFGG